MTCASCAARIEKKLNKLDGVTASVNYATEKAKVTFAEGVTPDELVSVVEATGYGATLPTPTTDDDERRRARVGRRRGGRPAPPAARQPRPDPAGRRAGHGAAAAVHQLAVALADPRLAGGRLGRVAVPPRRRHQRPARRRDDGHAHLGGRQRRLPVVAVGAVPRGRRHAGDAHVVHAAARAGAPAPTRSTSRWPPRSRCSSCPGGTSRRAPSGAPAPRCAHCSTWAPRTSPSCATPRRGPARCGSR